MRENISGSFGSLKAVISYSQLANDEEFRRSEKFLVKMFTKGVHEKWLQMKKLSCLNILSERRNFSLFSEMENEVKAWRSVEVGGKRNIR